MRNTLLRRLRILMPAQDTTVRMTTVQPKSSYEDAVCTLNTLQNSKARQTEPVDNGTPAVPVSQRTPEHLKAVGLEVSDLDDLKIIHVAGTKGKGSTCAFAESILRQYGFRTGLYTSPHLVAARERIRINGKPLSEELFTQYFWQVYRDIKAQEGENMPGYFRFLTVMAFKVFVEEKVDVVVLEVGVGGENDSTNVIRSPTVVGITSLGLDHTRLLGYTVQEIAWHKAGIFKKNCPAFTLPQPEKALEVLQERAQEKGCSLSLVPPLSIYEWETAGGRLGISGEPQQGNASLALQLCKTWLAKHHTGASAVDAKQSSLGATEGAWVGHYNMPFMAAHFVIPKLMANGLEQCRWPGRCQTVPCGQGLTLYLDGAHTEESLQCCVRWWREASTAEQQALGAEVQVRRMLLFNCIKGRRPEVLLSYLADESFHVALFTPNRIGLDKSPHSDQSDFTVDESTEMAACDANMHVWCHMLSSLHEEYIAGSGDGFPSPDSGCSGMVPEDSCLKFRCLSEAVHWVQEQHRTASQSTPPSHIQVLATGSLHLVGGIMSLVNPDLALSA